MEDKKIIYVIAIIAVIILILIGGGLIFFLPKFLNNQPVTPPPLPINENSNTNTNTSFLPGTNGDDDINKNGNSAISDLAKEKEFISMYWQPTQLDINASIPTYQLPFSEIKEQVSNYRDFSRKIDLEKYLEKLSTNGFIIINNPFNFKTADWENSYKNIKENELPVLITSDSIIGLYQDALQVAYKEIEQNIFYPSLWELLRSMQSQAFNKYENLRQKFGIENDLITEANRLELAYLTVALKLMQAEPGQIKEAITADNTFFTPQEAQTYQIVAPEYLRDEIKEEIKLINNKTNIPTKSPILLYEKTYNQYEIPESYLTSQKLKNYYLALTWLNDVLFPLWHTENDCPECILDKQDHKINFVASLYLSNDLASDQNLKNRWANIYKSISFFKGLESNLTYLDYNQALKNVLGENFNLDETFSLEDEIVEDYISKLQTEIDNFIFLQPLKNNLATKSDEGLKFLRNYHLLENNLFTSVTYPATKKFNQELSREEITPFTICKDKSGQNQRCAATALDLFSALGNNTAKKIIIETENNNFNNYQQNLDTFKNEIDKFTPQTWHDNSYLSLLFSLKYLDGNNAGWPTFMKTDAWQKKNLNTALAAWVNFHREINFEKTEMSDTGGLQAYFPYGYIEPQVNLYQQLLDNVNMVIDGFVALQIITEQDKTFDRLKNLKETLEKVVEYSKAELENNLDSAAYSFINNFDKRIRSVTGDVKKENFKNPYDLIFENYPQAKAKQTINNFNYLIVAYLNQEEKLVFAIGPVFEYSERNMYNKLISNWQENFISDN